MDLITNESAAWRMVAMAMDSNRDMLFLCWAIEPCYGSRYLLPLADSTRRQMLARLEPHIAGGQTLGWSDTDERCPDPHWGAHRAARIITALWFALEAEADNAAAAHQRRRA